MSARSGRRGGPVCGVFETLGDDDHCETAIENERRGKSQDKAYRPEQFLTRRAALQATALLLLAGSSEAEQPIDNRQAAGSIPAPPTISLDHDIIVSRSGKTMVIDADAMWHALEAARKIPL